jgi:protein arginine kinase
MTDKKNELTHIPVLEDFWRKNTNSIWLATTIALHRNIEKFHFPSKLDSEKKQAISTRLTEALLKIPELQNAKSFLAQELTPLERDYLFEHFLIFEQFHDTQKGQSFVIDGTGSLLCLINIQDHLVFHTVDSHEELEKSLSRLVSLEQSLEKSIPYAFSPHFGYLTSDTGLSGTGLTCSSYLHVPALIFKGELRKILEEHQEGLIYSGLQGNPDDLIGDLLVIKNRYSTGTTEESILSSIRNASLHITMIEKEERKKIQDEKNDTIIDNIARALGLLKNSHTLDTSEALRSISLVKFGVELGWVTGISLEKTNELFFDCRRAHLALVTNSSFVPLELHKARAHLLKEALSHTEMPGS